MLEHQKEQKEGFLMEPTTYLLLCLLANRCSHMWPSFVARLWERRQSHLSKEIEYP